MNAEDYLRMFDERQPAPVTLKELSSVRSRPNVYYDIASGMPMLPPVSRNVRCSCGAQMRPTKERVVSQDAPWSLAQTNVDSATFESVRIMMKTDPETDS